MRIARFDGGRIGVVQGELIFDVTDACGVDPEEWPPMGMVTTIAAFADLRGAIERAVAAGRGTPLADVRLDTPIPWPHKLLALPANFRAHAAEMSGVQQLGADEAGFFMKSAGSISGPADPIVLPHRPGRTIHHECEMAIVIGTGGRHIPLADAGRHIFGYACLIDVTLRGDEERVTRKSYDTFCRSARGSRRPTRSAKPTTSCCGCGSTANCGNRRRRAKWSSAFTKPSRTVPLLRRYSRAISSRAVRWLASVRSFPATACASRSTASAG